MFGELKHDLHNTVIIIEVAVQYDNGVNVIWTIILAVSKHNPDLPNGNIHHFGKIKNFDYNFG